MMRKFLFLNILILILPILSIAEIKVTSLPSNKNQSFDRVLFGASETRNVFLINDNWKVYHESDSNNKVKISVPAVFDGEDVLVFERSVELNQQQIERNNIKIGFLGLNNSAEISVNGNNIFIHHGGAAPFEVSLPKDLLRSDKANKISIKINRKLDSETTIPVKQRFLFPDFDGGLLRDVYLKIVPQLSISKVDYSYSLNQSSNGKIDFSVRVENNFDKNIINHQTQFYVRAVLRSGASQFQGEFFQNIGSEENYDAKFSLDLTNPILWSPQTPNVYECELSLIKDGVVVDKQTNMFSIFSLKKTGGNLFLNGERFSLNGTTYFLNESFKREKNIYEKIREDLSFIKQTGFNSVRFAKNYPHPYALKVCQEIGLLALIELPLNSIPEFFLEQNDFKLKAAGVIKEFASNYLEYSSAVIVGIGGGYLPNSNITEEFLTRVGAELKKKNIFTYASFIGAQTKLVDGIDLYGFEIFSVPKDNIEEKLSDAISNLGANSIFFSEVTYPNYKGNSSGYLVRNSKEAQAKYFEEVINYSRKNSISGFFINSLFGYFGAFPSLYAGYDYNSKYGLNVVNNSGNTNFIAYKVLQSKLTSGSKVTIPIGSRKDDNPIIFILISLFLSIVMAVLINTKKKFREDATRALVRPYNFFADIRDHRILSGIHTAILMLIIAASASLLITIILFYLRNDILFERLLLSFASTKLMLAVSYLAWNPQVCLLVIFVFAIIKFALLSLVIKTASFFVKTRVPLSSIYFSIIWAFLPLTLFLPIELVLYKVLSMEIANTLIGIIILLFLIWLFFRMMKGIYVIFDVRQFSVYLYSFIFIFVVLGGLLLKYQLTHQIIYYLLNAVKQFNAMIS